MYQSLVDGQNVLIMVYKTHLDKGVLISDVVHYNGSLAITVVDWTEGMVNLLTCCVLNCNWEEKAEEIWIGEREEQAKVCVCVCVCVCVRVRAGGTYYLL